MVQQNSFFEGHRGGVLSLAGDIQDNFFYSSGSEGLIVRWQLNKPNEGQVLVKLSGYVSSLAYVKEEEQIYATVNHIGIYIISAKSGRISKLIDLPGYSFGVIFVVNQYIIVTTKLGELIFLENKSHKIVKRVKTGLTGFSQVAYRSDLLWFTTSVGVQNLNLKKIDAKGIDIEIPAKVKSIGLSNNDLVILTKSSISVFNFKKQRFVQQLMEQEGNEFHILSSHAQNSNFYILTSKNEFLAYNIVKKEIQLVEKLQFGHKEQINDLLWIENYKFVISASADKKIGVWQIN